MGKLKVIMKGLHEVIRGADLRVLREGLSIIIITKSKSCDASLHEHGILYPEEYKID